MTGNNKYFGFGNVIQFLKDGKACRRSGWNGKGLFIVKQVPSHIEGDIIPTMQSLPISAKHILMSRENPHINYTNQMLIINPDGESDYFVDDVIVLDKSFSKIGDIVKGTNKTAPHDTLYVKIVK